MKYKRYIIVHQCGLQTVTKCTIHQGKMLVIEETRYPLGIFYMQLFYKRKINRWFLKKIICKSIFFNEMLWLNMKFKEAPEFCFPYLISYLGSRLPASVSLGCYDNNTSDWVAYKQQKFMSNKSGCQEVQDQGVSSFSVCGGPFFHCNFIWQKDWGIFRDSHSLPLSVSLSIYIFPSTRDWAQNASTERHSHNKSLSCPG